MDVSGFDAIHRRLLEWQNGPPAELELLLEAYVTILKQLSDRARLFEYLASPLRRRVFAESSKARQLALEGLDICAQGGVQPRAMLVLSEELAKSLGNVDSPFSNEEVRLAAVRGLQTLLDGGAGFMDANFWLASQGVRGMYGWVLSQLLERIVAEQNRLLRFSALECAVSLFRAMKSEPKVAAAFLPGYLSVMQKTACGDYKQGVQLTQGALEAVTDALAFVFPANDNLSTSSDPFASLRELEMGETVATVVTIANESEKQRQVSSNPTKVSQMAFLTEMQDPEWRQQTLEKSVVIVHKTIPYIHRCYGEEHDESSLRSTLASSCGKLLLLNNELVSKCAKTLVDILVLYASDEWPLVAETARCMLKQVEASSSRNSILIQCVQESLHELIIQLPRLIRGSIDTEKLTKLRFMVGYGRYLGPKGFPVVLTVSQVAMVEAVLQVMSIDRRLGSTTHSIAIVEASVSKRDFHINDDGSIDSAPRLVSLPVSLLFCSTVILRDAAFQLCALLSQSAQSAAIVLDNLLNRMEALADDTAECLIVCGQMALHFDSENEAGLNRMVQRVLDIIVSVVGINGLSDPILLGTACYFISIAAKRLQRTFSPHIRETLPFLLQCLGHSEGLVSDAAWVGLENLTLSLGQVSVHEMIRFNADYVVDQLVKDLRIARGGGALSEQRVPFAVYGILRHSPTNAFWLLDDILAETIALLDSSGKRDGELVVFAKIFAEIAAALQNAAEKAATTFVKEEKGGKDADNDEENDEWSRKATSEQIIATKILDRVRNNFIACRQLGVQLDALRCVSSCLQVLAQTRKELYPGIYAVWDPLMKRLESFDPSFDDLALVQVASLLGIIARLGQDFLSGDKFEQMWKSYARILKWGLDCNKRKESTNPLTYAFRLQKAVLESMFEFAAHVPIPHEQDSVRKVIGRYSETHHPEPLALLAERSLAKLDEAIDSEK